MKGRKKLPVAVHILNGNPGKRKLNLDEPKAVGAVGDAPEWFTPLQRTYWEYALVSAPEGVLGAIDRDLLATWATLAALHEQAAVQLQDQPLVVEGRQNPLCRTISQTAQQLRMIGAELGFTPSGRARLSVKAPVSQENPFAKLIAKTG